MTALGTKDPALCTQTAAALVPEAWLSLRKGLTQTRRTRDTRGSGCAFSRGC